MVRVRTLRRASATVAVAGSAVSGAQPNQPKLTKAESRSTVTSILGQRVKLSDYRSTIVPLTAQEREIIIDQALVVLEKTYAHLPLKRALHANDPIQSLRLIRLRHTGLDERAFQSAVMDVFISLRDLHTNYVLPSAYHKKFAFLPFRVEEFYEPGGVRAAGAQEPLRKYVVSWVSPINTVTNLKEGVIVTHWNGAPIDLAVARNGAREAGSNRDARRAQGIEALTLRWLGMSLPPDEDWVVLTYSDGSQTFESRFEWEVIDAADRQMLLSGLAGAAKGIQGSIGVDLKRAMLSLAQKQIFDPQAIVAEEDAKATVKDSTGASTPPVAAASTQPDVFPRFGEVTTPSGKFGYVRLKTFAPETEVLDVVGFTVNEFARILSTLPQTGLILDVRGNGGGYINIGEQILQMLTPHPITPEGFHFLVTPMTLDMASEAANGLGQWRQTILEGLENGATFSQGFSLTNPDECNRIGQIYQGPVVLVTDALCYSTTDMFAAGFQDHNIGPILGCHQSTGAGGANVWQYSDLRELRLKPSNPFAVLPKGADMRVAIRRSTRIGARSGMPVEDYGAATDIEYYMTKADVVGNNEDVIAAAGLILKGMPRQRIKVAPIITTQQFSVETENIDRFDILLNARPVLSQNTVNGTVVITLPATNPGVVLTANGYRGNVLVASTRIQLR